jgi:hypothetical protein
MRKQVHKCYHLHQERGYEDICNQHVYLECVFDFVVLHLVSLLFWPITIIT